jgi:hypothetical protein
MVGIDWLTRLTGRMDMSPPGRTETIWLPKYCRSARFDSDEFQQVLRSETLLAPKIGIGNRRRKSINRSDGFYRSG